VTTNDDTLLKAVGEVQSIAQELVQLRDKIKEYGEASKRLNDVSSVLGELSGNVLKIQDVFYAALEQARLTQVHAETGQASIESMVASIPAVVERIEAMDSASLANTMVHSMQDLGTLLQTHAHALDEISTRLNSDLALQARLLGELHTGVEQGNATLGQLSRDVSVLHDLNKQGLTGLRLLQDSIRDDVSPQLRDTQTACGDIRGVVDHVQRNTNRAAETMATYTEKMLREMAVLKDELVGARTQLAEQQRASVRQNLLLEELSKKKKGWFA